MVINLLLFFIVKRAENRLKFGKTIAKFDTMLFGSPCILERSADVSKFTSPKLTHVKKLSVVYCSRLSLGLQGSRYCYV